MRRLKVLFVYKYLTLGGVEAVVSARLAGLDAHGVEAHAWFFQDLGGRSLFRGHEDRVRIGPPAAAVRWAAQGGFDLLCSIDTEEVVPLLAADPASPSWVMECHSGYVENIRYLANLGRHPPAMVLVPSEEQSRLVLARLATPLEVLVVPNLLAEELLAELAPCPAPPPRPVVLWVGRLDELKNWRGFLELGGRVLAAGRDVELWIAGRAVGSAGASELLAAAREAGVLPRLRWLAGLPHARVPALLDGVRDSGGVFVSTSRRESFGLSVAEAMARACAVLVPDQPPFDELVAWEESLYRPGSWSQATQRLLRLLADPALRAEAGRRGRAVALERLAPAVVLPALATALRNAASR